MSKPHDHTQFAIFEKNLEKNVKIIGISARIDKISSRATFKSKPRIRAELTRIARELRAISISK